MGSFARDDSGCVVAKKEKAKAKKEIILERPERLPKGGRSIFI